MWKTILANLRAHKARMLLSSLTVVLGVGFVAGTLIFTDSISKSFYDSFARRAQNVDAAVLPSDKVQQVGDRVGQAPSLSPAALDAIRQLPDAASAEGRVFGQAPLLDKTGKVVTEGGTAGFGISAAVDPKLGGLDLTAGRMPTAAGEVAVDEVTAADAHFNLGDSVAVLDHNDVRRTFTLVGVVDIGTDKTYQNESVAVFQTATAFDVTGRPGYDEIDVRAGPGVSQSRLTSEIAALPAVSGTADKVVTGADLAKELANSVVNITDILGTVLLVFALIALLVSALVIQNTFGILVAQRARELALLRCIGATRRQVFGGTVGEAAVFGLAASLAGFAAGIGLAAGMSALLRALGTPIPPGGLVVSPRTALVSVLLGVVLTTGSALLPARAATRVAPVQALSAQHGESRVTRRAGRLRTAFGLLCVAGGIAVTYLGMQDSDTNKGFLTIAAGGGIAFLGVLALGPVIAAPIIGALGWLPGRVLGPTARLATANARRNPRRVAATTAALTIGITLVTAFTVVTSSMKASATGAIARHYPFDYQVAAHGDRPVPAAAIAELRTLPQFAVVAAEYEGRFVFNGEREQVNALDTAGLGTVVRPDMVHGGITDLVPGTVALLDTQLASLHTGYGQTVDLTTADGAKVPMRVAAVYTDSGIGMPEVAMTSQDYVQYFGGPDQVGAYTVDLVAKAGVSTADSRNAVDAAVAGDPLLTVKSQADYRASLSKQLDQILALFSGLLGLAILIALIGIANTLALSVIERTRESALLRALGLTRPQLRRMLMAEALLMAVLGVGLGVVMGGSFGWAVVHLLVKSTSDGVVSIPYVNLLLYIAVGAGAGVLAAVLPARRAARATVAAAITDV